MNVSFKLLLSIFITFPCLGMEQGTSVQEQFPFELLPKDIQGVVINSLVESEIKENDVLLPQAQTYNDYKKYKKELLEKLNSYKFVNKNMCELVSRAEIVHKAALHPDQLPIKKQFWKKAYETLRQELSSNYLSNYDVPDNIDARDSAGNTLLVSLAKSIRLSPDKSEKYIPLIRLLLDNAANPNYNNGEAIENSFLSYDTTHLLLSYGASPSPLIDQIISDSDRPQTAYLTAMMKLLIRFQSCSFLSDHILVWEIRKKQPNPEIIELLFITGLNPNTLIDASKSVLEYIQQQAQLRPELTNILAIAEKYAQIFLEKRKNN